MRERTGRAPEPRPTLTRVTSTDQVVLSLHDFGHPDGRPVLLAHATGFHGRVWGPLARHLTGYHAVALDFRGHGDSPRPVDRGMDWNGFADDVLAVVDAWGVSPLWAVGHSKGGAALLLAEQRRPGTFEALYCYEPVAVPRLDAPPGLAGADNPLAVGALKRRPTFDSFDDAYANFASKPPLSSLDPEALRAYVEHGFAENPDGTVELKCRPEVESEVYRMGAQHDLIEHLAEVTCPVTLARGAISEFGPAALAAPIAEALPNGRLVVFDDLGHFGPLEAPARVAASVLEAFGPVS